MTLKEYEDNAWSRASEDVLEDPILCGVLGLGGEAGECLDYVKKNRFQLHPFIEKELALEVGDVCWYIAILARSLGYTFEEILEMNVEKCKKRYPNGFETERSIHREE